MTSHLIQLTGVRKEFRIGNAHIEVLKGIDLSINKGEFVAIMGSSGSGKSTLLNIIGCLDRPTSGAYFLDGRDMAQNDDKTLSYMRANRIGFVFQTFNLLHQLNIYENVELSFLYATSAINSGERVMNAIGRVGLSHRLTHKPFELSGGEMQRVAIARALCKEPELILADEPTGNLDSTTGNEILGIFRRLHSQGATLVMVTHDREVAACAERIIIMKDGTFVV